jgi:FtsH-binding integral membrane protein
MMDKNEKQPTLSDVMKELDEIKKSLKAAKKRSWMTLAALATSCFIAGTTVTYTAEYLSKAYWWGWGLMGIGLGYFLYIMIRWNNE